MNLDVQAMKTTRTTWLSVIIIFAGIVLLAYRPLWSKTRTWVLVDQLVSLSKQQEYTFDFASNLNALYLIEIEAQKDTMPYEVLNCLLGVENCKNIQSAVHVSWVVSSQGVTVAQGSSADTQAGDWKADKIARQIGSFNAHKGRHYTLNVNVLGDGAALTPAKPRLRVEIHPAYYENFAFGDIPFVVAGACLVLVGMTIFAVSSLRRRSRPGGTTVAP